MPLSRAEGRLLVDAMNVSRDDALDFKCTMRGSVIEISDQGIVRGRPPAALDQAREDAVIDRLQEMCKVTLGRTLSDDEYRYKAPPSRGRLSAYASSNIPQR